MSRNNKARRKEKQQQQKKRVKRRKEQHALQAQSPRWKVVCERADRMARQGSFDDARRLLEEYENENPGQNEVLSRLLSVYTQQEDGAALCRICRPLVEQDPDNRPLLLALASGYVTDDRIASGLAAFRRFYERWPLDPLSEGVRESIQQLEPLVEKAYRHFPFVGEDRFVFAAMHEDFIACAHDDNWSRAILLGNTLLERSPDLVEVLDPLCQAYFQAGRANEGIALTRGLLRRQPDNGAALAILTHYLFLNGRQEEALELGDKLRDSHSDQNVFWRLKAEAFSFLGDDQAVLGVLAEAERAGALKEGTYDDALVYHLAAVSAARCGDQRMADRHWQAALDIEPDMEIVLDNQEEAGLPTGESDGPWSFTSEEWLGQEAIGACREMRFGQESRQYVDGAPSVEQFADAHPEVVGLIPALLDRGDPEGREIAMTLAMSLKRPEMLAALRVFCFSQRGADAQRLEVADFLCRHGAVPPDNARLWILGEWQEIDLIPFEVTAEPSPSGYRPDVQKWAEDGYLATERRDGKTAEALFRRCIEAQGERPEFLNNLAAVLAMQNRKDEAEELIQRVVEHWPDYVFGRIATANQAVLAGDYERAENLLAPIRRSRILHITEFNGLAVAYAQLYRASGRHCEELCWGERWKRISPFDPNLASFGLPTLKSSVLNSVLKAFERIKERLIR